VPLHWQGRGLDSGPLEIELDSGSPVESCGALDYESRRAQAEFHVRLSFPQLSADLEDLGVDPELTQPVRAILRSEGEILEDHSFLLSGRCELLPHELFRPKDCAASVLPGT
jgi:hypothetical protein